MSAPLRDIRKSRLLHALGVVAATLLVLPAFFGPAHPLPGPAPSSWLEAQQPGSDDVVQALDSLGHSHVESGSAVGLGLGVYRGGEPILSRGYGYADLENHVPVTDSTVFRVGSVTKQFTAAAILRLEEEGRLSLDDDLTRFVPEFPTSGRDVTIHQLLNHTSGVPSYTNLGEAWQEVIRLDLSHDELLDLVRDEPFDFEPGEGFEYNNTGYYLLGLVIEAASGMEYDEYLRQAFFEPLELGDTRYCWESPVIPRRARGYQPGEDGVRNADPLSMAQPYAAGALCSSVRDLARWDRALRTGEVVSLDSYRRMVTPVGLPQDAPMRYGYGLVAGELDGAARVEHGGGIPGFNAVLAHYPEEDLTVVALVNLNGPAAGQAAEAAARIALGIDEPAVVDLPMSAEERARYVGAYDIQVLRIRVFEEGDRLMAQGEGQPSFRLLHQGGSEFRAEVDPSMRLVFTLERGRAERLVLHQAGLRFEGPRVP